MLRARRRNLQPGDAEHRARERPERLFAGGAASEAGVAFARDRPERGQRQQGHRNQGEQPVRHLSPVAAQRSLHRFDQHQRRGEVRHGGDPLEQRRRVGGALEIRQQLRQQRATHHPRQQRQKDQHHAHAFGEPGGDAAEDQPQTQQREHRGQKHQRHRDRHLHRRGGGADAEADEQQRLDAGDDVGEAGDQLGGEQRARGAPGRS